MRSALEVPDSVRHAWLVYVNAADDAVRHSDDDISDEEWERVYRSKVIATGSEYDRAAREAGVRYDGRAYDAAEAAESEETESCSRN